MRCQFCGWDIPDSNGNCEKCGKPMQADASEPVKVNQVNERQTTRQSAKEMDDFRATVRERRETQPAATILEEKNECPDCGYELENGVCPSCGYDSKADKKSKEKPINMNNEVRKTVRPCRKGEKEGLFVLTPISEETGLPEGDQIQYEGNEVELSRENTDPKNETITSQKQAIIIHENGRWCIEDKSHYKTTFVQAARKIELQNGDLILLGNQLYQFNSMSEE